MPEGGSKSMSQNIVDFILKNSEFHEEFKFAVCFFCQSDRIEIVSKTRFVSLVIIISAFEHNIEWSYYLEVDSKM